jgi:hypothetical protein
VNFLKVIGRIAALPITIVADAITMGGVLTDEEKSYTAQNAEKLMREITKDGEQ